MSKGKWRKHHKANPKLLKILKKKGRHMTTNELREELDKTYNIKFSHQTAQAYLQDLELAGHLKSIVIEKKNKVRNWTLRGLDT